MTRTKDSVKVIEGALSLGFTLPEAVSRALGTSLGDFARQNDVRATEVSMCLNAYHQRTYPNIRDAICEALGIPREYLDRLIEAEAAKRAEVAV